MNRLTTIFFVSILTLACEEKTEISTIDPISWEAREVMHVISDSLTHGSSYLSVYSQIYTQTADKRHDLTATISMRNTNLSDTIYIKKADFYSSNGTPIKSYFDQPIFIAPMETLEIVIPEGERTGGTGANFIFHWAKKQNTNDPYFEGIMISTSSQQGLSFTTQGIRIR